MQVAVLEVGLDAWPHPPLGRDVDDVSLLRAPPVPVAPPRHGYRQVETEEGLATTAVAVDRRGAVALLEEQVVPSFYDRDERQIPRRWLQVVREAMRSNLPRFSARRMVKQYVNEMYMPAAASTLNAR